MGQLMKRVVSMRIPIYPIFSTFILIFVMIYLVVQGYREVGEWAVATALGSLGAGITTGALSALLWTRYRLNESRCAMS